MRCAAFCPEEVQDVTVPDQHHGPPVGRTLGVGIRERGIRELDCSFFQVVVGDPPSVKGAIGLVHGHGVMRGGPFRNDVAQRVSKMVAEVADDQVAVRGHDEIEWVEMAVVVLDAMPVEVGVESIGGAPQRGSPTGRHQCRAAGRERLGFATGAVLVRGSEAAHHSGYLF